MKSICIAVLALGSMVSWGQGQRPTSTISLPQDEFAANGPSNTPTSSSTQEYRIGKDDLIEVSVFEDAALSTTSRVTAAGTISLSLIGSVKVADRTPQDVERLIADALKQKYVNDPHVT